MIPLISGLTLLLAPGARASEPVHASAPIEAGGEHAAPAGEHAAAGEHEGAHHVNYSDDDDLDGIPNWRDPMTGNAENTSSYVLRSIAWHGINLAILLGVLVWAVRRPLADTFRDRALAVRNELTGAARAREEAQERHRELVARLERIEGEVAVMEQQSAVDAQREEEKLVERANREAARIAEQAERNLRDETNRARLALRNEAVELAVQLAEATLKQQVSANDRQDLAREFLRSLKEGDRV